MAIESSLRFEAILLVLLLCWWTVALTRVEDWCLNLIGILILLGVLICEFIHLW